MCEFQQQCHVVLCMLVQVLGVWGQRQIKLALHKDKKQCHYRKQGTHMQHKCISHTYYHYRDGGSKQASSGCKVDLSLFYHSIDVLVSYEIYFPVYMRRSVHIQRPDQQTRIICILYIVQYSIDEPGVEVADQKKNQPKKKTKECQRA